MRRWRVSPGKGSKPNAKYIGESIEQGTTYILYGIEQSRAWWYNAKANYFNGKARPLLLKPAAKYYSY
jgi:hypothetical protein